jgi:hypothetical protein
VRVPVRLHRRVRRLETALEHLPADANAADPR